MCAIAEAESPVQLFHQAEKFVRENGFSWEVDWCDHRPGFDEITEQQFLREYAWVVLNSGMRNSVVQANWKAICKTLRYFHIKEILDNRDEAMKEALAVFGNYQKIDSIIQVAEQVWNRWLSMKREIKDDPLKALDELPFIGPVTKFHLARNLGFNFIKPDRHLTRLASKYGMTAFDLCGLIHQKTGRGLGTIDVVLWRYCEQKGQARLHP